MNNELANVLYGCAFVISIRSRIQFLSSSVSFFDNDISTKKVQPDQTMRSVHAIFHHAE